MVFLGVMLLSFMATHTPLVEKVAVIRHQLGLAEGLNVADTVAEAVKQLGLVGEVAGRDLIQRADACLVMLRLPAETMPTPEQAAEVRSALDCKRLGYSVSQCKDRGFTAVQCKEAGYSAAELIPFLGIQIGRWRLGDAIVAEGKFGVVSGLPPNRDDRPGIRYDDGSGHRQKGGAGWFNGADTDNPGPPRALAWIEDTDPHLNDREDNSNGCAAARKQRSKLDQSADDDEEEGEL